MKKRKKVGIEWGKNTGRKGGREEKTQWLQYFMKYLLDIAKVFHE